MPQTKMTMQMELDAPKPALVVKFDLLPRGSGNRRFAKAIAHEFRTNPTISPHVISARSGTSRVVVRLRPSMDASRAFVQWSRESRTRAAQQHTEFARAAIAS